MAHRKLRMGMIGGGKDAFIGAIHRLALNMDGLIELVCGALSHQPEDCKRIRQNAYFFRKTEFILLMKK